VPVGIARGDSVLFLAHKTNQELHAETRSLGGEENACVTTKRHVISLLF
jgi:hypothetical protein